MTRSPPRLSRPPGSSRRRALVALAALALASGCAAVRGGEAPGCAGPRRPANPHGSVLAPDQQPPEASAPAGGCRRGGP